MLALGRLLALGTLLAASGVAQSLVADLPPLHRPLEAGVFDLGGLAGRSREPGATTVVLDAAAFGWPEPFPRFDGHPLKAYDFDGDGAEEAILQGDDRHVYVLDLRERRVAARLATTFPADWSGSDYKTGPEAAILVPGGPPALVSFNAAAVVTVFHFEGRADDGSFRFARAWERRLDACFPGATNDSRPVLADLDRDGRLEILAQTEEVGVFAMSAKGAVVWSACIPGGNGDPAVADVNADGHPDVVWVADHGVVSLLDGKTRRIAWTFWAGESRFNLSSASMPVAAAVAQLDGKGPLDIVVGARDSHDPLDWSKDHAALFALSGDGKLLWMRQDPEGAPLTYTRAIARDLDGDGETDILWADWNNIGHKPPWDERLAWKRSGPSHVYRYDADGQLVWRVAFETRSHNKDLLLLDVDGDGESELLANGPGPGGEDGVWALDLATGARKTFHGVGSWSLTRGPVAGDFDGSGRLGWMAPVDREGVGAVALHGVLR